MKTLSSSFKFCNNKLLGRLRKQLTSRQPAMGRYVLVQAAKSTIMECSNKGDHTKATSVAYSR